MENKVDLNRASDRDVMNIHGISDAVAQQIIYYRRNRGAIRRWEELKKIPLVSDSVLDTLREKATLGISGADAA